MSRPRSAGLDLSGVPLRQSMLTKADLSEKLEDELLEPCRVHRFDGNPIHSRGLGAAGPRAVALEPHAVVNPHDAAPPVREHEEDVLIAMQERSCHSLADRVVM